jgi:hypothetical protein
MQKGAVVDYYSVMIRESEGYGLVFECRQGRECSLLHIVHTEAETHPGSYPMGTAGSFLDRGVKLTLPTSSKVKKALYSLIRLHGVVLS